MPFPTKRMVSAPRTVIGYHGCSMVVAQKILTEQRFEISRNTYDWLGEGAYFWEYAPYRARQWAQERYGGSDTEPAIIGATLRLGRCLNLLDTQHAQGLARAYSLFAQTLGSRKMPRNTASGAHFLDREIVDTYARLVEEENQYSYQSVRGSFAEGEPVYPGSKILTLAHVQIAVRDLSCISKLHLVKFG